MNIILIIMTYFRKVNNKYEFISTLDKYTIDTDSDNYGMYIFIPDTEEYFDISDIDYCNYFYNLRAINFCINVKNSCTDHQCKIFNPDNILQHYTADTDIEKCHDLINFCHKMCYIHIVMKLMKY